jgi:hypothetical protein
MADGGRWHSGGVIARAGNGSSDAIVIGGAADLSDLHHPAFGPILGDGPDERRSAIFAAAGTPN